MAKPTYRDVTADADARAKLDEVTPLSAVLQALRFERVGLIAPRAELSGVQEIWRSPDADAFAEPEWHPGRTPHLVFRTRFDDGTILQTSEPRRGWFRHAPLWVRQHHPKAGYLMEEPALPPHELWLRHRARVEEQRAQGRTLAKHDSLDAFLTLAERSFRLTRSRMRLSRWGGLLVFLPLAVFATLWKNAPGWALPLTAVIWLLATWLFFRAALLLPFGHAPQRRTSNP